MDKLNRPANGIKTSAIVYDGQKVLFGNNVKKGMPFYEVMCVISSLMEQLYANDLLECIDLKDLGITCPDKDKSKACIITEWITSNILATNITLATLVQNIQILQTGIGLLKDEKVKVRAAGNSGYLESIIDAPGSAVTFDDNQVHFLGFVPIGTRATINRNRLPDFDNTGKGKLGTDVYGWAIRNGNNGLSNVFGLFQMFTDSLANAETTAGTDSFTVKKDNIESFTMPVTGIIQDALQNNVKFKVGFSHHRSFDGKDGPDHPLKDSFAYSGDQEWFTWPANFKHSHAFNLTVTHTKPAPTPIALLPRHIKEIPIERIIP